ncbi:MAG: DNA primase [Planctomycetota bacterium]
MSLVPEQTVAAVREATDIVALIGESVRDLKPSGKHFKARCPFHDEKSPSFMVSPERQTYKCFGCQEHGDVFAFVMKMDGLGFYEALKLLAQRAGIKLDKVQDEAADRRDQLFTLHRWVADFFRERLMAPEGRSAREYVASRGLSPESSQDFLLGYAPDQWDGLLEAAAKAGHAPADLLDLGLVIRKDDGRMYDRFRGRLMFPIFDAQSRITGFGARTLTGDDVKYINTPETPLFRKSQNLYGIHRATAALRRERTLVLVEGYTDVIMAHQMGFHHVVAALGTAINEDHVRLIRRWADRVILTLDGDKPGQDSAARALKVLLAGDMEVRLATLPEGLDPCDLLVARGSDPFRLALATSVDPVEFGFRRLENPGDPDRVHTYARETLDLLGVMPSPARRELYLHRLSDLTGVSEATLKPMVREVPPSRPRPRPEPVVSEQAPRDELGILTALVQDPSKAPEFVAAMGDTVLEHPLVSRMVSTVMGHLAVNPASTSSVVEGLFQTPVELELLSHCRQLRGNEAQTLFRDCLASLKRRRIRALDSMAQEARGRQDEAAYRTLMDTRYKLSQDLSGALRRTS